VELNGKSVQMPNMERAEVGMEGIIEKSVVDGKVDWRWSQSGRSRGLLCLRRPLLRRSLCLGRIGERSMLVGGLSV
jgi:hypothetical protein